MRNNIVQNRIKFLTKTTMICGTVISVLLYIGGRKKKILNKVYQHWERKEKKEKKLFLTSFLRRGADRQLSFARNVYVLVRSIPDQTHSPSIRKTKSFVVGCEVPALCGERERERE